MASKEEMRQRLWCEVYSELIKLNKYTSKDVAGKADYAVERFDECFPPAAISERPVVDTSSGTRN